MRVISGKNRGCKLVAPKGMTTRPTDDRLKENIFNLLGPIKKESKILDLFAGTGQIGIEFLSRGASQATFIDRDYSAIKAIKQNLEKTRNTDSAEVIKGSVETVLKSGSLSKYNYIYIDPPYDDKIILKNVFNIIIKSDIIEQEGMIIFETVKDFDLEFASIYKSREYGSRKIIIVEVNR